jgi:hypothetical protein
MLEIAKNKMETKSFFPLKKLKLLNRKINLQKLDKATRQQTRAFSYDRLQIIWTLKDLYKPKFS